MWVTLRLHAAGVFGVGGRARMSAGPEGKAERMKTKNPKRLLW